MNQVTYFGRDNEEACNYQLVVITCCKKTNRVCVLVLKKPADCDKNLLI